MDELITFPRARHDDFVDALSLALGQLALGAVDDGVAPGWRVGSDASARSSAQPAPTFGWSHAGSGSTEELERSRWLGDGESR